MPLAAVSRVLAANRIGQADRAGVSCEQRGVERRVLRGTQSVAGLVGGDQAHVLIDQLGVTAGAKLLGRCLEEGREGVGRVDVGDENASRHTLGAPHRHREYDRRLWPARATRAWQHP